MSSTIIESKSWLHARDIFQKLVCSLKDTRSHLSSARKQPLHVSIKNRFFFPGWFRLLRDPEETVWLLLPLPSPLAAPSQVCLLHLVLVYFFQQTILFFSYSLKLLVPRFHTYRHIMKHFGAYSEYSAWEFSINTMSIPTIGSCISTRYCADAVASSLFGSSENTAFCFTFSSFPSPNITVLNQPQTLDSSSSKYPGFLKQKHDTDDVQGRHPAGSTKFVSLDFRVENHSWQRCPLVSCSVHPKLLLEDERDYAKV